MLSYQHGYHAGSPADVHKHVALGVLMQRLVQKDKPCCALDVFAGEGLYDLTDSVAAKTGEYKLGIGALWGTKTAMPPAMADYIARVRVFNPHGELRTYPGSPALLRSHLRADDRLIVNELHPTASERLEQWALRDERITVHRRDGLEATVALAPPSIRRGVMVIDPSYEGAGAYEATGTAVARAAAKWATGIYVVWYPLLADARHRPLLDTITRDIALPSFTTELTYDLPGLKDAPKLGLRGTGLAIINPPWQFENALQETGDWVARNLPLGRSARHALKWMKAEA